MENDDLEKMLARLTVIAEALCVAINPHNIPESTFQQYEALVKCIEDAKAVLHRR